MLFLAGRQLLDRLQQSMLTLTGIALGTAAYVMFSGIMLGFQDQIVDLLVNTDAHIRISPRDQLRSPETYEGVFFPESRVSWITPPSGMNTADHLSNVYGWYQRLEADPRVAAFAPQLNQQVMVGNASYSVAAVLFGVEPARQRLVSNMEANLLEGSLMELSRGNSLAIIGSRLQRNLGVRLNGRIQIVTPTGKRAYLKVVGIYEFGNSQLDQGFIYTDIHTAQALSDSSSFITDIVVRLHDVSQAAEVATQWSQFTRDKVESWDQANESLLSVFQMQDVIRSSLTAVIVLIIAFGIYNILNMVVFQKQKEIAILRSIGFDQKDTIQLFLIQGLILGVLGSLAGLLIGFLGCLYISTISIGGEDTIRQMLVSYKPSIYIFGFSISVTAAALSSFLPARRAAKLQPIEIIRGAG
ncbi:MAG: ABC transporter permease [Leptospiraceae bacterium]|nr:ABC transporter permease [Leptospiraceae bacterium]MCB1303521.1 ABC transporter permease [Leptospiraceae bacterium]